MTLPQIDVNSITGMSVFAPELAGIEAHAVKVLPFAHAVSIPVGKHVRAMMRGNFSHSTASVAGDPGVANGVKISHSHFLPDPITRTGLDPHGRGAAFGKGGGDVVRHEDSQPLDWSAGQVGVLLLAGQQIAFVEQGLETREPVLVVAVAKIIGRMLTLARMTARIDIPFAEKTGREGESKDPLLPLRMKHRLARLRLRVHWTQTLHTT